MAVAWLWQVQLSLRSMAVERVRRSSSVGLALLAVQERGFGPVARRGGLIQVGIFPKAM